MTTISVEDFVRNVGMPRYYCGICRSDVKGKCLHSKCEARELSVEELTERMSKKFSKGEFLSEEYKKKL